MQPVQLVSIVIELEPGAMVNVPFEVLPPETFPPPQPATISNIGTAAMASTRTASFLPAPVQRHASAPLNERIRRAFVACSIDIKGAVPSN